MVRKRYTVAVVGLGGATAAQRSEVSRHRRERDALAAAGDERDRLAITYGSAARNYRIAVEYDGRTIHEIGLGNDDDEPRDDAVSVLDTPTADVMEPHDVQEDTAGYPLPTGALPAAEEDVPSEPVAAATDTDVAAEGSDAPESARPDPAVDQEQEMSHTAAAVLPGTSDASTHRREAMPTWDDVPSGPVPAEVLRYFESAVAREEARTESRRRDRSDAA